MFAHSFLLQSLLTRSHGVPSLPSLENTQVPRPLNSDKGSSVEGEDDVVTLMSSLDQQRCKRRRTCSPTPTLVQENLKPKGRPFRELPEMTVEDFRVLAEMVFGDRSSEQIASNAYEVNEIGTRVVGDKRAVHEAPVW